MNNSNFFGLIIALKNIDFTQFIIKINSESGDFRFN